MDIFFTVWHKLVQTSHLHKPHRQNTRSFCDEVGGVTNWKVGLILVSMIMVSEGPDELGENDEIRGD